MKNRQVNHARNIWDRAITILPRVNQFWWESFSVVTLNCHVLLLFIYLSFLFIMTCFCAFTGTSTHTWRRCWGTWLAAGRFLRDGWSGSLKSRHGILTLTSNCATRKWKRPGPSMRDISFLKFHLWKVFINDLWIGSRCVFGCCVNHGITCCIPLDTTWLII